MSSRDQAIFEMIATRSGELIDLIDCVQPTERLRFMRYMLEMIREEAAGSPPSISSTGDESASQLVREAT